MKVKRVLVMILMSMQLLTGCWDQQELNYILIVSGIGIDKVEDGRIRVALLSTSPKIVKSPISNGSDQSENSFIILAEEGESIVDACNKISMKLSREILFSQIDGIIIGEEMAKQGLSDILDFFPRMPQIPMKAYITFTKGEARDILNMKSHLEYNTVKKVDKIRDLDMLSRMYIKDFIYMMTEEGIHPCTAFIGEHSLKESDEQNSSRTVGIKGGTIFNKDKLVGYISQEELRGILWVKNRIKNIDIFTSIPQEEGGGKVSGNIIRTKTKIIPVISDDGIKIEVNVFTAANIIESSSKLDFSKTETIRYVEKLYSKEIKNLIEDSITSVMDRYSLDVFGFGTVIHGKFPNEWKEVYKESWDEKLRKLDVEVSSIVRIEGTGFDYSTITRTKE